MIQILILVFALAAVKIFLVDGRALDGGHVEDPDNSVKGGPVSSSQVDEHFG